MVIAPPKVAASRSVVALRVIGWVLVVAGLVVVLYLVYSLLFTSRETDAAQSTLADEWAAAVPDPSSGASRDEQSAAGGDLEPPEAPEAAEPAEPEDADGAGEPPGAEGDPEAEDGAAEDPTVGASGGFSGDPDRAVAILEFSRPGTSERPVASGPLYVVGDVSLDALKRGPGHYPRSADPGEDGNFAVAGHRTTYGAPFFRLDDLRPGDEVHATGRDGRRHTYRVREQRIVSPGAAWVVSPDPLGSDRPLLTLTTCHPRFSARQRLVVWAELV